MLTDNIKISKYKSLILLPILLLVMAITMFWILPDERVFKHEYRLGAPWTEEDLIAPFNFPIHKSADEIKKEIDSLKRLSPVFYVVDTQKIESHIQELRAQIKSALWLIKQQHLADIPAESEECIETVISQFKNYLSQGVLDSLPGNRTIMVLNHNEAVEYSSEEIPLKQNGSIQFRRLLQNNCPSGNWIEPLTRLVRKNYTQISSLSYDSTFTNHHFEKLKSELSLTRGLIQEGQRIISRGDVVTSKEYRLLESLQSEYKSRGRNEPQKYWALVGRLIISLIVAALLLSFMVYFRRDLQQYHSKTILVVMLAVVVFVVSFFASRSKSIDIYLIPFAIIPIVIRVFFDTRFAIFIYSAFIIVLGLILPNASEFIFMQFIAGVVAVFSLRSMIRRKQFSTAAINVFIAYSTVYIAFTLLQEGDISKIEWMKFVWFAGNAMLILWSYPLLYLFEKTFGFMSDVTLMELSDTSNPLLRKLSEVAPGTFQHSLQVSNLAESAIRKIGGNPLLVYVGALYHDIGKIYMPQYFIENQNQGINPHQKHTNVESAQIIISHVEKGVELAKKHHLPEPIIDFIRTHHGDGLVQYFYRSQVNANPSIKVDPKDFQYQGPLPSSKETAVLMLSDAVEASSRSLKTITPKTIDTLVEKIVDGIVKNNQLRNADLSFKDIQEIKEIFKNKLNNIYHSRIEYPELEFPTNEESV